MLIDWFTVGAQVLNFIILVWLLKHFLYRPILTAIDTREKRIAAELADAASKQLEATQERTQFESKRQAFDLQCAALLEQARQQAKAERERLMQEARESAAALRATQAQALQHDQQKFNAALAHLAQNEVFDIARKALADLATADLEERIGAVFTRKLRELDAGSRTTLASAIKISADPVLVRSGFELPPREQATIHNALNEAFAAEVRVRFESAPGVICGIELTVSGQKLGWSIAEYLQGLEHGLDALLDAQVPPPLTANGSGAPAAVAAAI
jgi:F-type H+-transporting ATPase subunit b